MKEFVTGLKSEFAHITWPSRGEALGITLLVVVIAFVIGYYLGALDMFFSWLLKLALF